MKHLAAFLFGVVSLIVVAAALQSCVVQKQPTTPQLPDPHAIRVEFLPSLDTAWTWRSDQMDQAHTVLKALHAFGPSFEVATDGVASFTVRMWYSDDRCTQGVARWFPGSTTIEVDASCAHGYTELRAAIGHEIGHAMGLGHVCFSAQDVAGSCRRDGHYGPAMMNPDIAYGDPIDAAQGDPLGVAVDAPTYLDILEFRRAHAP